MFWPLFGLFSHKNSIKTAVFGCWSFVDKIFAIPPIAEDRRFSSRRQYECSALGAAGRHKISVPVQFHISHLPQKLFIFSFQFSIY